MRTCFYTDLCCVREARSVILLLLLMPMQLLVLVPLQLRSEESRRPNTGFVVADFEDDELHDRDWMHRQPPNRVAIYVAGKSDGLNELSLGVGEGRGGGNALVVRSGGKGMGLPSFWILKGETLGGSIRDSGDESGYLLPRGQQANRLEFWVRFDEGFRERASRNVTTHNAHLGTYHFDPGLIPARRVVESDNWHFYHEPVLRHDLAHDEWIHVVLNEMPHHQRGLSQSTPPLKPTGDKGRYWELLTRFYFEMTPVAGDPEIGYPHQMWIDDIRLVSVVESNDVRVRIEDFVDGQYVPIEKGRSRDLRVSIQNSSSSPVRGRLYTRQPPASLSVWLLDPDSLVQIPSEITLPRGQTRELILRIRNKDSGGDAGVLFVPESQETLANHSFSDRNVEVRDANSPAPTDAALIGAFVRVPGLSSYVAPASEGGVTYRAHGNETLVGLLKGSHPHGKRVRYSLLSLSENAGRFEFDPKGDRFRFYPATGYTGVCRFRYEAVAADGKSRPYTSWIYVSPPMGVSLPE